MHSTSAAALGLANCVYMSV